jgi:hypothetical protein
MKCLGIGPVVTAHSHMEIRDIKKGMCLLGDWRLRLFGETIVAVKFEVGLTIDMDEPFRKFGYQDIWNRVE